MVSHPIQIQTLTNHPNLKFFLTLPADVLFQTYPDPNGGNDAFVIAYATGKAKYAKNWALNP